MLLRNNRLVIYSAKCTLQDIKIGYLKKATILPNIYHSISNNKNFVQHIVFVHVKKSNKMLITHVIKIHAELQCIIYAERNVFSFYLMLRLSCYIFGITLNLISSTFPIYLYNTYNISDHQYEVMKNMILINIYIQIIIPRMSYPSVLHIYSKVQYVLISR